MTQTTIRDSKDTLAKLMASENITVVHRKVPTAYFDLENRVLCCPILKDDISPELYDLFMGHEVGHALNTPYEGLHSTVTENASLKGYLNVIEDVRIERDIKNRYQGLKRSFHTAYNELMEINFFGVDGKNLDKISLIDKINLITKCGSRVLISMSNEEQKFLDMAESCETWEDVVECATAIFEYSKEKETRTDEDEIVSYEKTLEQIDDSGDEIETDEFNEEYGDTSEDGDETEEEMETQEIGDETDDDEEEVASEEGARESVTDHFSHKNETSFIDEEANMRTEIDLLPIFEKNGHYKNKIVTFKKVLEDWRNDRNVEYEKHDDLIKKSIKILSNKNKKIVNHMVREFEMQQTAHRFSKAITSKTGKLDTNRLAKYKIVDDIFKRTTILPDGKNHGVVVLLDWSSSIVSSVPDMIEQALILVDFCRKTNIPYRIFLFSDYMDEWCVGRGSLLEIFSNEMSNRDHNEMMYNVACLWYSYFTRNLTAGRFTKGLEEYNKTFETDHSLTDGYIYFNFHLFPKQYNLGGTPLDDNLIVLRTYLPNFRKMYALEKCVLTILTDGYSHSCDDLDISNEERAEVENQMAETDAPSNRWNRYRGVERYMRDPYSRKVYRLGDMSYRYAGSFQVTQNLLHWISAETGFTVTGYFCVKNRREFQTLIFHANLEIGENDWKEVSKTGKVYDTRGYNKLFVCKTSSLGTQGDDYLDEELKEATVRKIGSAFLKNQKSKISSRFLANEFIKEIA